MFNSFEPTMLPVLPDVDVLLIVADLTSILPTVPLLTPATTPTLSNAPSIVALTNFKFSTSPELATAEN